MSSQSLSSSVRPERRLVVVSWALARSSAFSFMTVVDCSPLAAVEDALLGSLFILSLAISRRVHSIEFSADSCVLCRPLAIVWVLSVELAWFSLLPLLIFL